jgi:hypothetical protein
MKRLRVSKKAFDSALSQMLNQKPAPREQIKVSKKKPASIIAPKN